MKFFTILALIFLVATFPVMAEDDLPVYLADPAVTDPDFPPAMWAGSIDSEGSPLNYLAYLANGEGPHPTAILLHGFPGNEKNLDLAQAIRRIGWNVVFFHYRGAWGSGGKYSVENSNQDVSNVIDYLQDPENAKEMRVDPDTIALVGHSFGGFKAFYGAVNNDEVVCVVGIAFSDIGHHIKEVEAGKRQIWPWIGDSPSLNGYSNDIAVAEFTRNGEAFYVMGYGPRLLDIPTLIVTPDGDGEASVARQLATAEAFENEGVNLTMALIENADHSFNGRRVELMKTVTEWLNGSCLTPKQ